MPPVPLLGWPCTREWAKGPSATSSSSRGETENFTTSFRFDCEENSGESVACMYPVSNCRKPTGVSVAGVETVGRPGLATGSSEAGTPAVDPSEVCCAAAMSGAARSNRMANIRNIIWFSDRCLQRSFRPQKKHRNADAVLHAVGGRPQKHVGQKAVSVSAHGDQIASFLLDPFNDLVGGFAESQFRIRGNSLFLEFLPHFLQVGGVFHNFAADLIASVCPGGPSVGDVQQYQTAVRQLGEILDVLDDRPVGGRAVQRHKNGFVHNAPQRLKPSSSQFFSRRLSAAPPKSTNPPNSIIEQHYQKWRRSKVHPKKRCSKEPAKARYPKNTTQKTSPESIVPSTAFCVILRSSF